MSASGLRVERDGAVVRLTLSRGNSANVIGLPLANALRDAYRDLAGVRVVVIRAEGSVFCGGGDMREVMQSSDPEAHIRELAEVLHEALLAMDDADAVTIAEVDGAVAGGGLGLVLHADLIVASTRARFLTAYDRIAVTPDSGVTDLLPRTIGLHRALQLTVGGVELDAETAAAWGLVSTVVDPSELEERVASIAARLAANSVSHLRQTSRMYRAVESDHAARLRLEADTITEWSAKPEARALLARFAGSSSRD